MDADELRDLAKAATPGPWRVSMSGYSIKCDAQESDLHDSIVAVAQGGVKAVPAERWAADAEFIAAANPAIVLGLLDEIRLLREKLADAVRNLEPWKKLATDHATNAHDAIVARDEVLATNRKLVEENDALTMRVAELVEAAPDPRTTLSAEIAASNPSFKDLGATRDLMTPYQIGMPAKVLVVGGTGSGNGLVYGRVAGFGGTAVFDGAHPQLVVRTPGGSIITAGRIHVCALESEEDLRRLAVYESKSVPCPTCGKAPTDVEQCCWCCHLNEGYRRS